MEQKALYSILCVCVCGLQPLLYDQPCSLMQMHGRESVIT